MPNNEAKAVSESYKNFIIVSPPAIRCQIAEKNLPSLSVFNVITININYSHK